MTIERRRWTDHVVVLLLAGVATVPWLEKAFHIDDVLYLMVADQILKTPSMPYGDIVETRVLWDAEDGQPASLFKTDFNPPLWKYVLAAAIDAFGHVEWKLHLVSAGTVFLAAWGIYFVSRRWTERPLWCVAMVLLGPFFLPAQNLMIEPPLLCLTSWATYFMARSWERDRTGPAFLAGTLVGMAVLTKYTSGLFLGVFVFGCVLHRRPKSLVFLVPATALLGLWLLHNDLVYGKQHITSHGVVFKPAEWPVRILIVLRILGSVSLFWPIWAVSLWRRGVSGRIALVAIGIASLSIGWLDLLQAQGTFRGWGISARTGIQIHFVAFTSLGALTLLAFAADTLCSAIDDPRKWRTDKVDRFLDIWILLLIAFNITSVPFNAVRHLLFLFLAMTWRSARVIPTDSRSLPVLCLVPSIVVAMALSIADYEFANRHRDFARTTLRRDVQTHRTVWYTGNWGWVWYALEQGALPYLETPQRFGLGRVEPGDRIYHPEGVNWRSFHPYSNRLKAAPVIEIGSDFPVRTIVFGAHYYGVLSHTLPWVVPVLECPENSGRFELVPLDRVRIFDVLP